MKKTIIYVGVAGLIAAVVVNVMLARPDTPVPEVKQSAQSSATGQNMFPFVRSMDGTKPDGQIKVKGEALVVDAELGRMFDYYLSAVGEKSLDAIRAEIERDLERRLKPGPAAEAKRLLGRYFDYKRELAEVEKNTQLSGGTVTAVRGRLQAMQKVRSKYFSASEAEGLFGFNDAYDLDAIARLEVVENKTLTDAQKKEKFAAIDAAMSPALREEREAPLRILKLDEKAQQMRANGATEDEIYRMRSAALSPDAAARLAQVDQEEAAWKTRIAGYLTERNTLMTSTPEAQRHAMIQQLRDSRFSPDEQKRLPAYE